MRCSNMASIASLVAIASALAACGGSPKQAGDASSQNAAKSDDEGAPKWDSSSTTTTPSSSSSGDSTAGGDTAASGASPNGSSTATGTSGDTAAAPAAGPQSGPHNEAEIALKRAARQAKANCGAAKDSDGKALGPFGKTTVNITLGRNGHSKNVTLDSSYDGKPAGNCIIQAFKNLTYAPWAGADMTVQWEVELVQPK
ncbi:MAG: hypothetical protein ABI461_12715 [Polyangiaceae bacterium]